MDDQDLLLAGLLDEETSVPAEVVDYSKITSKGRTPTLEQQQILEVANQDHPVIVIQAGAGTGKTTTYEFLSQTLRGNGQYTAFNTSLVESSKSKFAGTKVACNTTHSLAYRAIGRQFAHRLNGERVKSWVIASILGIKDFEVLVRPAEVIDGIEIQSAIIKNLSAVFLAGQVTQAIRRFCQSADRSITTKHFRYIDGIDLPTEAGRTSANNSLVRAYLVDFAKAAWEDLSSVDGQLPFSHDVYVKLWQLGKPVIASDYILVDEAQDTAPVFLDILRQQSAKIIVVGDSAQQIYEWRGAVDALSSFGDVPTLQLSQSFRFGVEIAAIANEILGNLSDVKLRLKGLPTIDSKVLPIANPTAILTRTNALAVSTLLNAVEAGKKPFLVGGGADVISFVKAAIQLQQGQKTSHPELACFDSWGEVQEYVKLDEGEDLKLLVNLVDEFGSERILSGLQAAVSREDEADLVISTAHKSKGREWDYVQLGCDFPSKEKSNDSDLRLLYVAVTRAKLGLDVTRCSYFQDDVDTFATPVVVTSPVKETPKTEFRAKVDSNNNTFTWSKGSDGEWLVRGPRGNVGKSVEVVRKNGTSQSKKLKSVVWEDNVVALYKV